MIKRFSSRRETALSESFLTKKLAGAKAYDRIAGYFTSSIFEVAGEALDSVTGKIRMVCNSEVDPRDWETARAADLSSRREWYRSNPEEKAIFGKKRFERLYNYLKSGKLLIKVLPSQAFGLIHGKAGVITLSNNEKTAFLGSVNESIMGWKLNYELLWEDDSPDAIKWVQEEFDALWNHPLSRPLSSFIINDIDRISKRVIVEKIDDWKTLAEPAAIAIEEPVYRESIGLAEHQKYFVKVAFDLHRTEHGARLILADSVGLGKTIELGMTAKLIALYGSGPILILVPRTILYQWQNELNSLLALPSAVWDGKKWIDENGNCTPISGPQGILKCPRRIGIVSQGIITRPGEASELLKSMRYECVIVDESHRARRSNLGPETVNEKAIPNNLLKFIFEVSKKTKSMLLATATPVQLHPIEVWDLLNAMSQGSENVMGNASSIWRHPDRAIELATGKESMPKNESEIWDIIRNPLPQSAENPREFTSIRESLNEPSKAVIAGDQWEKLRPPDRAKILRLGEEFGEKYNPFIRHIIRRTREYLEEQVDENGEPLLAKISVSLFGEDTPIILPGYLKDAYGFAEEFCHLLGARTKSAGFLKTMLLRRAGSTMEAGRMTAERILKHQEHDELSEEEDEGEIAEGLFETLTENETQALKNFLEALETNKSQDPKVDVVVSCLKNGVKSQTEPWLDLGCIIFSQYYDSVWWLANVLVKEFPQEKIGVYAGGSKSGLFYNGDFKKVSRDLLKELVFKREMRLIVGTDAASEGLNLQTLGTLINLDLPWNPTRLEQRKGRIQRIGQTRERVYIYNMRYKDSVEDRVHALLSKRLKSINELFGQIPDVLEDVWVEVALGQIEEAKKSISKVPEKHPFKLKYGKVEKIDWESCRKVLDADVKKDCLKQGW